MSGNTQAERGAPLLRIKALAPDSFDDQAPAPTGTEQPVTLADLAPAAPDGAAATSGGAGSSAGEVYACLLYTSRCV